VGFVAALLLAVAAPGQPALAFTTAPAEVGWSVAPTSALDDVGPIVLGLREGLEETASRVGGRRLFE